MKFSRFDKKSQYNEAPHRTARLKGETMIDLIFNTFFACKAMAQQNFAPRPSISERGKTSVTQPTKEREEVANHFVLVGDGDTSERRWSYHNSGWTGRATVDSHFFVIRWAETIAASARLRSMLTIEGDDERAVSHFIGMQT